MRKHFTVFGLTLLLISVATGCVQTNTGTKPPREGRIAFIANYMEGHKNYGNYIVSMSSDGSDQIELARWAILTEGHSHLWSKDGKSLAYLEGDEIPSGMIRIRPSWLVVTNADGSERRRLLNLKGIEVSSMSLSPDGKTILLQCEARGRLLLPGQTPSEPIRPDPRVLAVPDLYAVDVTSGGLSRVTGDTDIIASYPVFSPDGRKIAFIGTKA